MNKSEYYPQVRLCNGIFKSKSLDLHNQAMLIEDLAITSNGYNNVTGYEKRCCISKGYGAYIDLDKPYIYRVKSWSFTFCCFGLGGGELIFEYANGLTEKHVISTPERWIGKNIFEADKNDILKLTEFSLDGEPYVCMCVSGSESDIAQSFTEEEKYLLTCIEYRIMTIQMMFDNPQNFPSVFFDTDLTLAKDIGIYELGRIMRCLKDLILKHNDIEGNEIFEFYGIADKSGFTQNDIIDYSKKAMDVVFLMEDTIGIQSFISNQKRNDPRIDSFSKQCEYFHKYTEITKRFEDVYIISAAILSLIKDIESHKTLELSKNLRDTLEGVETMYMMLIGNSQSTCSVEVRKLIGASIVTLLSITTSTNTYFDNIQNKCPAFVSLETAKRLAIKAITSLKKMVNIPTVKLPNGITI